MRKKEIESETLSPFPPRQTNLAGVRASTVARRVFELFRTSSKNHLTASRVDAAPALRNARPTKTTSDPTNDRVDVQVRDGEEVPRFSSPLLSSPVHGFDAPRRRVPQNATRRARNHCGTSTSWKNRRPSSANELPNTSRSADMKYSPQQQQQQQKQRKSESSDAASMDATSPSVAQEQRKTSSTSSSTRAAVCRSPSTGMFAWMRVFRLASMLHQVGC